MRLRDLHLNVPSASGFVKKISIRMTVTRMTSVFASSVGKVLDCSAEGWRIESRLGSFFLSLVMLKN